MCNPRVLLLAALAAIAASFYSAPARAAGMFHFGLQVGPSFLNGSSAGFGYGLTTTYRIKPFLAVGINYYRNGIGATANGATAESSSTTTDRSYYGGEANMVFAGNMANLVAGGRIGLVNIASSASTATATGTSQFSSNSMNVFFQMKVGYDITIGRFTAGPELSYTFVTGSAGAMNILGTFKFWL